MSSNQSLDATGFLLFADLLVSVLKRMQDGVSVTRYQAELPPECDVQVVLEVRVVRLNGQAVPRCTDSGASRARKGRR
jgi:hypothetical protein